MLRIASFDIGKKNFSQYVEDCDMKTLKGLEKRYQNLPRSYRRRVKGLMNEDITDILDKTYRASSTIQIGVYDLREDKESNKYDLDTRKNIIKHLDNYKELWKTCDVFVVEQQFINMFGRRQSRGINVDAVKIAEGLIFWLCEHYPDAEIINFGSTYKTQMLGAPNKMSKTQRKNWAIVKAKEILALRKEQWVLDLFDTYKNIVHQKLDDMSDCIVQCQAWKFKYCVGVF